MAGMTGAMGALRVRLETTSAAVVRRHLAAELGARGLADERIDEILVVASELVGNAIRHTGETHAEWLEVTWDVDTAGVTVRVDDPSTDYPKPRLAKPDEAGGRGLAIVRAMSDDWGVQWLDRGKRVWAHIPLQGVPA